MQGFSDTELIGYFMIHSDTPLALFHVNHIRRLWQLADMPTSHIPKDGFQKVDHATAELVCCLAERKVK
jgi:hypothetical protein